MDVPEIPWVKWMELAIRDMSMRPDDFWSLPFFVAQRLICPFKEDKSITRKELLEGERMMEARLNG